MKILIAGSDLNAKLFAQYIKQQNNEHDIYITTDEISVENIYTAINIKENNIPEICDFVKYNQIEFTIVTSELSIINGIADEFKKEGFPIFAPTSDSARITFFNSIAKKILYKLKINTPRFGIFDRENVAIEYLRKIKFPIIITNDFTLFSHESIICKTFSKAKLEIQKIFETGNNKIIIENYSDENPIYIYFITDGYNAMPLITINKYNRNGYKELIAPSEKISEDIIMYLLKKVIYPILDDITKFSEPYCGILGLKIIKKNNNISILEFYNEFQGYDIHSFLALLNDDLLKIITDTANGKLGENHSFINLSENYSYTLEINKNSDKINSDLFENICIESEDNINKVFTASAATINGAKSMLNIEESEYERI